jgi:hypothetical protein
LTKRSRPNLPLSPPTVIKHTEVAIDAAVLDRYAGRYEAQEIGIFNVGRESGFLTIQLPRGWGVPTFRLRPESRQDFFVAELPVRATFQTDDSGRVTGVLVYPPRGQHGIPAKRMSPDK